MFSFCKPIKDKKRFLPERELDEGFTFTLFDKADHIRLADWNAIVKSDAVFFNKDYLSLIEHCYPSRLETRYAIVYHQHIPCGIIYFQIIDFEASVFGDLLNEEVGVITSKRIRLFEHYLDKSGKQILMRLFTCGNNLISGRYGFLFKDSINEQLATRLVLCLTDLVSREEKLRGTISATLIKDFEHPLQPESAVEEQKFVKFTVEPNMEVNLPAGINSLDGYIQTFSKKYRNRARSIFKAKAGLEVRELDANDLKHHQEAVYRLYENIYKRAKFKLLKLPPVYFESCKRIFAERFFVFGFFKGDELVAFCSGFVMGDTMEAHYIGLNYEANKMYELYQNILYTFIERALNKGLRKVNFGRTAAEIKSTVGAVPQHLECYIRGQNAVSRMIQKPFIAFLQPQPWIQRNPFKEELVEEQ